MKKLNKLRRTGVATAVAAVVAGAGLVSSPAHSMNFAQDGIGQVLLFPYYTVNGGWDTYVHVTNTSSATVVAKVRFREAKNSREVRDFNVILSPYDVWTAAVTEDGDGAKLVTYDTTCTSPLIPAVDGSGRREIDFTSLGYDGSDQSYAYDNGGRGIERTREGYFEVIMMGQSSSTGSSTAGASQAGVIEWGAKHVGTGDARAPRDCELVDQAFTFDNGAAPISTAAFTGFRGTGNVLKGFSTLINVPSGRAAGVEPAVLSNWRHSTSGDSHVIYPPGSLLPSLNNGTNAISGNVGYFFDADDTVSGMVTINNGLTTDVSGNAEDMVTALLMRRNVINEFSAAASTATDWVVTFPTKHFYTDDGGNPGSVLTADNPFSEWFAKNPSNLTQTNGKSCDTIGITEFGREEETQTPGGTQFSPRPSGGVTQLCNEVNVLTFNGSNVLESQVQAYDLNTSQVGPVGWVNMSMGGGATSNNYLNVNATRGAVTADQALLGLPTIGFAITVRNNASEEGNNRNYATVQEHSFRRSWDATVISE